MSFTIAISMRYVIKQYPSGSEERFNSLADTWFDFLLAVSSDLACIPMPSNDILCKNIIRNHKIDALILTGGDDIGTFPQRDEAEFELLKWAENNNIPVIGVCRGMQLINSYYGGDTSINKSHVATRHQLAFAPEYEDMFNAEVNSFHANCVSKETLAATLEPLAYTDNGKNVEAFKHFQKPIWGIMWHPEREESFKPFDINLYKKALNLRS